MVEEDKIFILAAKDSEEDGTNRKGPESYLVLDLSRAWLYHFAKSQSLLPQTQIVSGTQIRILLVAVDACSPSQRYLSMGSLLRGGSLWISKCIDEQEEYIKYVLHSEFAVH